MAEFKIKRYDFGLIIYDVLFSCRVKIIKVINHSGSNLFKGKVIFPEEIEENPVFIIEEDAFKDFFCDELVLPSGIILSNRAFAASEIRKIHIPSMMSIPDECFKDSWLEELTDSSSVLFIGEGAFAGTTNLKYFRWFKKVSRIPSNCFRNSGIRKIEGIQDVNTIQRSAFEGSKLEEIVLTGSVFIGPKCFASTPLKCIRSLNGGGALEISSSAISGCGDVDVSDFEIVYLRKTGSSNSKIKLKTGIDTVVIDNEDCLK